MLYKHSIGMHNSNKGFSLPNLLKRYSSPLRMAHLLADKPPLLCCGRDNMLRVDCKKIIGLS
jgi:hypothetical protein